MQLSWTALLLLCTGALLIWFWQDSLAAREAANRAATEACKTLGLQFLDGTVAFARLAFKRGSSGRVQLQRTYVFDYTANSIERRQGFVVLLGTRVESVGYAQEANQTGAPASRHTEQPPASVAAPVLHLSEWRARKTSAGVSSEQQQPRE